MINNNVFLNEFNALVRKISGGVEIYEGSTLKLSTTGADKLKTFTIDRVGENSKFFGFGICQKLTIELLDKSREITLNKNQYAVINFSKDSEVINPFPRFYIDDIKRDENTNDLTITAYDAIYQASKYTVDDLGLTNGYTIKEFVIAIAQKLGITVGELDTFFNTYYPTGANFDGSETLRTALDAVAEATQTIYFVDNTNKLVFKTLDATGNAVLTINKSSYFTLKAESAQKLGCIYHATELGDNYSSGEARGNTTTQYVRDNPFWDLREDRNILVDAAYRRIGGIVITPFICSWRGNFLLEIGDKIALITKDDSAIISYVLNDSIKYNGGLSEETEWEYSNDAETPESSANLIDTISKTYARVDKANKRIDLVVSSVNQSFEDVNTSITQNKQSTDNNIENINNTINQLSVDLDGISASVQTNETTTTGSIESINKAIESITKTVATKMTPEQVELAIKTELDNGIDKVITSSNYVFDETGLTISKSGREMTTQITEDGMTVYRDNSAVLVANNEGVNAENLHATTFLMIGGRSRFENFESNRTGCFWIGGTD